MSDIEGRIGTDLMGYGNRTIRDRHIGFNAMYSFSPMVAGSRGNMFWSQFKQCLSLNNPEEKIVQSGVEPEIGKGTFKKYFEHDSRIVQVVKSPGEIKILYVDLETSELGLLTIPEYNMLHTTFGFRYVIKDIVKELTPGVVVEAGTVVAEPSSNKGGGGYGFGVNLKTALVNILGVTNDASMISESAAKKMAFRTYKKVRITLGQGYIPLNLFGTKEEPKYLPDIGDVIPEDGIIFGKRPIRKNNYILLTEDQLMDYDATFDRLVFVDPGSKIVSIKITKQVNLKNDPGYFDHDSHDDEIVTRANVELRRGGLKPSPALADLIVDTTLKNKGLRLTIGKIPLNGYVIDVVTETLNIPTVGNKMATSAADKTIIASVVPDDEMPNGVEAILEGDSTVSRKNVGRLYEQFFSAISTDIRGKVLDTYKENPDKAYGYILDLLEIIGNEQYHAYKNATEEERDEILREVIMDYFYLWIPVNNPKRPHMIVFELLDKEYTYRNERLKFKVGNKTIETTNKCLIGHMYFMILGKLPSEWLSCASSYVNAFGIHVGLSKDKRLSLPYTNKAVRFLGETETRLTSAVLSPWAVGELRDRASSIDTHQVVYRSILTADKPTDIECVVDRDKYPYKDDIPLHLFKSIAAVGGIKVTHNFDIDQTKGED